MGLLKNKNKSRARISQNNRQSFLYYRSSKKPSSTSIEYQQKNSNPKSFKQIFHIFINSVIVACLIIFVGFWCSLSASPRISITGKTELLRQTSDYQKSFDDIFAASVFNKNKLTINTSNIANEIQEKHPEIGNATVVVPFFSRQPKVVVTSIKPAFIVSSQNDSYLIDEYGIATARIQDVKNIVNLGLVTITDEAGIKIEQRKPVFSQEQTNFLREIIYQLSAAGKSVSSISIPVSAYDIKVQIKDAKYYVKMNMQGDPRAQAGKYISVERELDKSKKAPSEYIDARVDDRVYIK